MVKGISIKQAESLFRRFIEKSSFQAEYGKANLSNGDHFGHRAIIVNCDHFHFTIAKIPGKSDLFSLGGVYIKTPQEFLGRPEIARQPHLIISKGGTPISHDYKMITDEWLDLAPDSLEDVFIGAVSEAKLKAESAKSNIDLSSIAFTKAQRRLLSRAGFRTLNEVRSRGAERAFLDIKSVEGKSVSENLLFALWAALNKTHPIRVSQEQKAKLIQSVSALSSLELKNHISMTEVVIERLSELGVYSMDDIRDLGVENLIKLIFKSFGIEDGYDCALSVYASAQREGGVSVENLSQDELAGFDKLIAVTSGDLSLKKGFSDAISDGFTATLSLISRGRHRQSF
ncbi:TfoX/Sxy family DNA transformation protein [Vibrio sp. PNB22_3_1]